MSETQNVEEDILIIVFTNVENVGVFGCFWLYCLELKITKSNCNPENILANKEAVKVHQLVLFWDLKPREISDFII